MGLIGGNNERNSIKLYLLMIFVCTAMLLVFSSFVSVGEDNRIITIRIALWAATGITGIFTFLGYLSDW